MAQECGFFNAKIVGDGEYDRVYLAEQFAAYFASFIGNGVFGSSMQKLEVVSQNAPNMSVKVLSGEAWINGWWYRNTEDYTLSLDIADGVLSRIDTIVLRWGNQERNIWLHVIKGTASSNPTAPAIVRNADYYDLELATVSVAKGTIRITQAQITDMRMNTNVCGWVTGVVDQIDTTGLWNQFTDYFNTFKATYEKDYDDWTAAQKAAYMSWVQTQENAYSQYITTTQAAYDSWVQSKQSDYDTWTDQKKAEYDAYIASTQKDYDDWVAMKQAAYDSWVKDSEDAYTEFITTQQSLYLEFVTKKQSDYNTWVQQQEDAYDAYIAQQKSSYDSYIADLKADYDKYTSNKKAEWEAWASEQEKAFTQFVETSTNAYDTWISQQEQAFSLWYSTHTQQWEQDFNTWFDSIKNKLSGDIATNLQNQIDELDALQPTEVIGSIKHDKNRYVQIHMYETSYACGVQGAGEGPAGGGPLTSTPLEYTMPDKNNVTFKAKPGFGTLSEIIGLSDNMYISLFLQKVTSLVLVIS